MAVGRVLAPWGFRGDLKVEPLAGPPDPLLPGRSVAVAGRTIAIERLRRRGRFLCLKLSGIDDRQAADTLRGEYLSLTEGDLAPLAEGEYYRFQLIGLSVRSTEGEPLGRVVRVLTTPGNDVFVVEGPLGEVLIPAIEDVVKEVDLDSGTMTVEVVPGLLPTRRKS
ncbi:MAG: 16S rRNA processing protein RimM [Chloroflexi bacterium]|nr:16S rRNA processing protein RimM [Chloroflexota bacterium]